jgi:hypothetical protein
LNRGAAAELGSLESELFLYTVYFTFFLLWDLSIVFRVCSTVLEFDCAVWLLTSSLWCPVLMFTP